MADFTQQSFMGASICNFNASLGWSNQTSQLSVNLVEDDKNGDRFTPKDIGSPIQFNYQGWIFNGLLQSWKRNDNQGGSPLYEVTLVDPREILEGVQVVIADYPGSVNGIFNLLNVYGFYESQGFGASDVNEAGMSWYLIQQGIQSLTAIGQSSTYGTSVRFNQTSYSINLTALPPLPYYYRIGGTNISVMDFIIDVCEAGGCDFFFTMVQTSANVFVIQVNVVNRRVLPQLGQIATFIAQQGNVTSSNYGYELLNNNTGKFVVGGAIEQINLQFISLDRLGFDEAKNEGLIRFNETILRQDGLDNIDGQTYHYTDGNIWPFWGFNLEGNAILGQGQPYSNGHYFILDSRGVEVGGVGAFYPTDVGEMRSALDSFESWMMYLQTKNSDSQSPAFNRYTKLGGISPLNNNLLSLLNGAATPDAIAKIPWAHLSAITARQRKLAAGSQGADALEELMRLYDFVRMYASEFYGKKYMVRVPFIYTKVEAETLKQTLSQDPVNEGFISEDKWIDAIALNLLPLDINRLTTEDGKIQAYVRFDNASYLDLSGLSPDDYIHSENALSVFVKCSVEPTLVYIDLETYYSPRAIIDLAGPVRILKRFIDESGLNGQIVDTLNLLMSNNFPNLSAQDRQQAITSAINAWHSQGASESIFIGKIGKALPPILVGLPLRSNIQSYGPWYIQGASGKIDFEKDDSLVPWNYAGYTVMNEAAQAKIIEALTNQIVQEAGHIEFPGPPTVQLGSLLIAGGPYVTDVNVNIGHEGATTTYRMQLAPRFGKFAKANVDRLTRIAKTGQRFRRLFRELNRELPYIDKYFKVRESNYLQQASDSKPIQAKITSSHLLLQGECLSKDDGTYHINMCTQPTYNFLNQSYTEYERKGIMSLDGLMVPFSTSVTASGIPHYGTVTGSGVTRNNLDPFKSTHGISQIARDTLNDVSDDQTLYEDDAYGTVYRGIALRGPLMIAGWGYDTNGHPTPSGSDGNFISNVRQKPDQWKVGPLYTKWDEQKQVWSAVGAGGALIPATARDNVNPDTGVYGFHLEDGSNDNVSAKNFLSQPVCSGSSAFLTQVDSTYYLVISAYNATRVVTNDTCVSGVRTITQATIYTPAAIGTVS